MPKPQKKRQNALDPIQALARLAAELGPDLPSKDSEIDEALLKRTIALALRFPAFRSLGIRPDTPSGRRAIYYLCAALVTAAHTLAYSNYIPEHQRPSLTLSEREPYILRKDRLVPKYRGAAAPYFRAVAKMFLQARNLDRLRICPMCEKLFYAPRKRSRCCSQRCTNRLRQRRWAQEQREKLD